MQSLLRELSSQHYINPLRAENISTYKASFMDRALPLAFVAITPLTKDPLTAFLQSCSEFFRKMSFRDKQRLRRIMTRWIWQSGDLQGAQRDGILEGTEFSDIEAVKAYFRSIEDGEMDPKYLQLLSLLYNVDIIMIEPFQEEPLRLIGTGNNDCICMLTKGDAQFIPVIVNEQYYHEKANDMVNLRRKYRHKLNMFMRLSIVSKETEDIRRNQAEIWDREADEYDLDDVRAIDDMYSEGFYKMLFEIAPIPT